MKNSGKEKRPGSPMKNHGKESKAQKTLSFSANTEENMQLGTPSGLSQDGGAHDRSEFEAPVWFKRFERRQEDRFKDIMEQTRAMYEGLQLEVDNLKDEVKDLTEKLKYCDIKIDDLENRSRRNNLIIFNLPEGTEGHDCAKFVTSILQTKCNIRDITIQRAHRTGKISNSRSVAQSKPRPIHVGFSHFVEKEQCRKALLELFKEKKFNDSRLFVSNDYSLKVQRLRKEKLPELRRLQAEGKEAFMVYPAQIKIRNGHGQVVDT